MKGARVPRSWETERLVLRQMKPAQADDVREYLLRAREFLAPWEPLRAEGWWDRDAVASRLELALKNAESDHGLSLHLALRSDPRRIIGTLNVANVIRGAMQGCTLGYGLAPDATGNGYMTEAVRAACAICFGELGLHRVEINVVVRNAASAAVARRAGFAEEGVSRRYLRIAGAWEDHLRFARLSDDPPVSGDDRD